MNTLLLRRLRRSLMRTKLRVFTVVLLITLSVYAGVVFSEHSRNAKLVYDDFYSETNLADLIVETYDIETKGNLTSACLSIETVNCESSLVLNGQSNYTFEDGSSKWVNSKFYGMEDGVVNGIWKIEGSITPKEGEVVIDSHFAKNSTVGMSIGDSIDFSIGEGEIHTLEVVGFANNPLELLYAEPGSLFPQDSSYVVAYLDVEYLAVISGNDLDARNTLNIDLEGTPEFDFSDTDENEGLELDILRQHLSKSLNESETPGIVYDRGDLTSPELLRLDQNGLEKATPFILGVLLFISGLVIAISLDRLIRTQSREIAVMKTVGASNKDVMLGYLLVPLFLGVPGVIAGILLGISPIGSEAFTKFYCGVLGIPVVITRHHPDLLLKLGLSALAIICLFGIRPAWKAAKIQPLDVLGQGDARTPNRFISKITSNLPPGIGLGLRSTFRKPTRLLVTLVALSLAMVILGGTMMFVAGFTEAFNESIDEQENWEYQISMPSSSLENVTNWADESTSSFELTLTSSATIAGTNKELILKGADVISDEDNALHRLNLLEGKLPKSEQTPREIILDEGSAELEGYSVGDAIIIDYKGTKYELKITGIAREISRSVYFHRADLVSIVGEEANGALLVLLPGGDLEDIRPSTSSIVEKTIMVKSFKDSMRQQTEVMQSVYAIGGLLAIAILFNTLLINLSERDSELATLRVLGASRSRLAVILTVEHTFIGLLGGIAGALASIGYYSAMARLSSTWAFHFPVIIDYYVIFKIIGFVLIAALLTTPVGIWRIGRMNLLEVVARHER
ncbi:MAG: FtsX-like permease family protein [Candidatus Poseidoniales archaeon]|nr:FtsX-like permease family protein [Candidatus Poseidoniales archaeon]